MGEYARIKTSNGTKYQIVDEERCMILDAVTGEMVRFGEHVNSLGNLKDALEVLKNYPHETRWKIVKLSCIASHRIDQ